LSDFLNTVGTVTCDIDNIDISAGNDNIWNFKTTDGIKWRVLYYDSSDPFNFTSDIDMINAMIVIDVNGDKSPNCANYSTLIAMEWSGAASCQNETSSTDIHGVMIRYDGKIILDPNDTFETEALSDPTKFTKEK